MDGVCKTEGGGEEEVGYLLCMSLYNIRTVGYIPVSSP